MGEKNIGIIGAGAVGLGSAAYLEQQGHNVTVYGRVSEKYSRLINSALKGGIQVIPHESVSNEIDNIKLGVKLIQDLSKLKGSDVVFISLGYLAHTPEIGKIISSIGLKRDIPIIIHPGKFLSTGLCEISNNPVSEISSSVFGTTLKDKGGYEVSIKNRKKNLSVSTPEHTTIDILEFMNELFGKDASGNYTFVNQMHPTQISLQNHDFSINTAAVCDNIDIILRKGQVELSIYALSECYSEIFEKIYLERLKVAQELGFSISPFQKRFGVNLDNGKSMYQLLQERYTGKCFKVSISKTDRRFIEDPLALQRFVVYAENLGVDASNSKGLLNELFNRRNKLPDLPIFQN